MNALKTKGKCRAFTSPIQAQSEGDKDVLLTLAEKHVAEVHDAAAREYLRDCLSRRDFLAVCNFDVVVPGRCAHDLYHLGQIVAFFKKRADLDFGVDREAAAWETFESAEKLCQETNDLLMMHARGAFSFTPRVEAVLHRSIRKIASILGDCPQLDEVPLKWGTGALTNVKKINACPPEKGLAAPACSTAMIPYLPEVLAEMPLLARGHAVREDEDTWTVPVEIHPARLGFVEKTWKTHRSVCVEPSLNSLVQLGIEKVLSQRLRLHGVDTRDQSRNRELARRGSLDGSIATVDLSSASDTISYMLVLHLLPPDWFNLLEMCRSDSIEYKGVVRQIEKFATMGNGVTFPLETLIFYALAHSCAKEVEVVGDVSVYGDDIIIPVPAIPLLYEVMHALGFIINQEKTFSGGWFRESCGADYLCGENVRPCFIKTAVSLQTLYTLHNFYVERGMENYASIVLAHIPLRGRLFGPPGTGDGHLSTDEWRDFAIAVRYKGYSGWKYLTHTAIPAKSRRYAGHEQLFCSLMIDRREEDRPLRARPSFLRIEALRDLGRSRDILDVTLEGTSCSLPMGNRYRRSYSYTLG